MSCEQFLSSVFDNWTVINDNSCILLYDFLLLKFSENWTSSDGEHSDHPASFRSPDSPHLQPACWHAQFTPLMLPKWVCLTRYYTSMGLWQQLFFFGLCEWLPLLNIIHTGEIFRGKITLCLDSCWNYRIVSMKVCRTTVNVTLAFVHQINVVQPTMCKNNRKTKQEVKEDP